MNKIIRLMFLVMVNQLVAYHLGIDTLSEIFWLLVASMSGIIYGAIAMADTAVNAVIEAKGR